MVNNHIEFTAQSPTTPSGNAVDDDDDIIITAEIPPRSPQQSSGIDMTYWRPGTTPLATNATPTPDIEVVAEVSPRSRNSWLNHIPGWTSLATGDHTPSNDSTSRWLSTVIQEPQYEPMGHGQSRSRSRFLPSINLAQSRPLDSQSGTPRYNLRRRPRAGPPYNTSPSERRRRSLRYSEPLRSRSGPGMAHLSDLTWMEWIHLATDIASNYQLPLGFSSTAPHRSGSSSSSNAGNRLHRRQTTGLPIIEQSDQDSPGLWSDWNAVFGPPSDNGASVDEEGTEGNSGGGGGFTVMMGGSLPEEPPAGFTAEFLSELANVMDPNYMPSQPSRSCDIPGSTDYVPPPALKLKVCQQKVELLPHFTRKVPNADPVEPPRMPTADEASPVQGTDSTTSTSGAAKNPNQYNPNSPSTRLAIICPKCHVPIHSMFTTTCGHILCTPCADSMDASESCPSCRTTIRKTGIRRLFL
ncbi:hypothetical protein IWQ61_003996 [Dispira simplex]|nr:hypothetical protein IWQ61_003996 [Dispira simplex]